VTPSSSPSSAITSIDGAFWPSPCASTCSGAMAFGRPSRVRLRAAGSCSRPFHQPFLSGRPFSISWTRSAAHDESRRPDHGPQAGSSGPRQGTRIEWHPIPIGLGIGSLGLLQLYRMRRTERERRERAESAREAEDTPPPRKGVRPSGSLQVQVMSTLPLKAMSRLWGRLNELDLPYALRVPGFKLYAWIFGVNLDEVAEPDLHAYPNLAAFFYRALKPGVRTIDPDPRAIVSPADGRVLQFGMIERGEVEQVKGMTYSLDALLGPASPSQDLAESSSSTSLSQGQLTVPSKSTDVSMHAEFARVNGISYTLPSLLSGTGPRPPSPEESLDASTAAQPGAEARVRADLARGDGHTWYAPRTTSNALYYVVIYLAPGDYHRFHSPVPWVVETRRHFAGELYSVSPYLQRRLPGLFTLNERVVLLGRWRSGFFSFIPVGATNVGSIRINFDSELRTNSLTTDTAADRAAARAAQTGQPYLGFTEATFSNASKTLGGHPLQCGEEMGGFQLGSSIVLVFEAPMGTRPSLNVGWDTEDRKSGWTWDIQHDQRVQVGQKLGHLQ
jgi:phosphatidylserine decarboxylase